MGRASGARLPKAGYIMVVDGRVDKDRGVAAEACAGRAT